MKLMIVGDSWGKGEWDKATTSILHLGIEHYLKEDGHEIFNISQGGISNLDITYRIENYFQRYDKTNTDLVLVFQTEYSRDYKYYKNNFNTNIWENLKTVQDLSSRWIERFYFRLSDISSRFSVPIKIIGGCGDTMYFDDMNRDYPGCDIVCQSFTNLILTGNHKISRPVFSWYSKNTNELVEKLHKILPSSAIPDLINDIDHGSERESSLQKNPGFFYPDGAHPNRKSHKILFDFLKSLKVIG